MKRIAYLCSEYPAISHTFIFREICSLREDGIEVVTASVKPAQHLEAMTAEEQQEAANTLVMKRLSPFAILGAHCRVLVRSPVGYLRMVATAFSFLFKGPKNPVKALGYLVEAGILIDWMKSNQVEHVHEHFANPTALVAMLAKRYGGITYSLSIHGPDIFYTVDSSLLREKVENATFVRAISHYCRSQLMRLTEHHLWVNFHIVRCGIDPAVYSPRPVPDNPVPEILCVGRLVPAKGQHILIEACAKVLQSGTKLHLTFVGGGEDRPSLEQLGMDLKISDHLLFTGALGQDEVRQYYDRADIFVLASFAEGVPVVLMEAMAKEIPVISTRITGIPELIDHGNDGLLATPGDVDDLARQIGTLLEDPESGHKLGKAGREKVETVYNIGRNNKQLTNLFQAL